MSPVLWGAITALSFGASSFVARIVGRAIGPLPAMLGNFAIGAVVIVLWFVITRDPLLWQLEGVHWLLGVAAGFTIGSLLLYITLSRGPVSVVAPLSASYPVLVIIGALALGIYPSALQWAAMAVALPGVWVVARSGRKAAAEEPSGAGGLPLTVAITLGATLIISCGIFAGSEASEIYGPFQTILAVRVFGLAILLVIVMGAVLSGRPRIRFPMRWWPALVVVGLLDVGAVLALVIATQGEGAAIGSVASSPYAVVTVLLAWLILREPIPRRQWGGILLVIVGVGVLAGTS